MTQRQTCISPADVSKFFIGPRFGFLSFFSNDLTSGGGMGLENGGCEDSTFNQFFLFESSRLQ